VRLTGWIPRDQLYELFRGARGFIYPSTFEGFGMPVLEAMAAGVPVIAGNRSALPEVCGDAAEQIDPDSEEQLASALLRLATDEARRNELIARGLSRSKQFPWEKAVAKTQAVYDELLAG
jgi:glycosyltransferase involved in cell wall biosynthesis